MKVQIIMCAIIIWFTVDLYRWKRLFLRVQGCLWNRVEISVHRSCTTSVHPPRCQEIEGNGNSIQDGSLYTIIFTYFVITNLQTFLANGQRGRMCPSGTNWVPFRLFSWGHPQPFHQRSYAVMVEPCNKKWDTPKCPIHGKRFKRKRSLSNLQGQPQQSVQFGGLEES